MRSDQVDVRHRCQCEHGEDDVWPALLRCSFADSFTGWPCGWPRSYAAREVGEREPDAVVDGYVRGDLVVVAPEVLHDRVSGRDRV